MRAHKGAFFTAKGRSALISCSLEANLRGPGERRNESERERSISQLPRPISRALLWTPRALLEQDLEMRSLSIGAILVSVDLRDEIYIYIYIYEKFLTQRNHLQQSTQTNLSRLEGRLARSHEVSARDQITTLERTYKVAM